VSGVASTNMPIPAPLARDLRHWSSCARIWRLEAAPGGATQPAATCGARLEDLEAQAAKSPRRSMQESAPTFFRLPDGMRDEARLLDPGLLLRAGSDPETHRFIERFAEYLEFLGVVLETKAMRARACIVAPASISTAIVRPFADTESHEDDVVVCCNLSDGPARLALRGDDAPTPTLAPTAARASAAGERAAGERGTGEPSGRMSDSIALALEMGECLVALRRSTLGYIPDEQGEPTLWFECLLRNKSSGARLP
jgi:hypothetical protein